MNTAAVGDPAAIASALCVLSQRQAHKTLWVQPQYALALLPSHSPPALETLHLNSSTSSSSASVRSTAVASSTSPLLPPSLLSTQLPSFLHRIQRYVWERNAALFARQFYDPTHRDALEQTAQDVLQRALAHRTESPAQPHSPEVSQQQQQQRNVLVTHVCHSLTSSSPEAPLTDSTLLDTIPLVAEVVSQFLSFARTGEIVTGAQQQQQQQQNSSSGPTHRLGSDELRAQSIVRVVHDALQLLAMLAEPLSAYRVQCNVEPNVSTAALRNFFKGTEPQLVSSATRGAERTAQLLIDAVVLPTISRQVPHWLLPLLHHHHCAPSSSSSKVEPPPAWVSNAFLVQLLHCPYSTALQIGGEGLVEVLQTLNEMYVGVLCGPQCPRQGLWGRFTAAVTRVMASDGDVLAFLRTSFCLLLSLHIALVDDVKVRPASPFDALCVTVLQQMLPWKVDGEEEEKDDGMEVVDDHGGRANPLEMESRPMLNMDAFLTVLTTTEDKNGEVDPRQTPNVASRRRLCDVPDQLYRHLTTWLLERVNVNLNVSWTSPMIDVRTSGKGGSGRVSPAASSRQSLAITVTGTLLSSSATSAENGILALQVSQGAAAMSTTRPVVEQGAFSRPISLPNSNNARTKTPLQPQQQLNSFHSSSHHHTPATSIRYLPLALGGDIAAALFARCCLSTPSVSASNNGAASSSLLVKRQRRWDQLKRQLFQFQTIVDFSGYRGADGALTTVSLLHAWLDSCEEEWKRGTRKKNAAAERRDERKDQQQQAQLHALLSPFRKMIRVAPMDPSSSSSSDGRLGGTKGGAMAAKMVVSDCGRQMQVSHAHRRASAVVTYDLTDTPPFPSKPFRGEPRKISTAAVQRTKNRSDAAAAPTFSRPPRSLFDTVHEQLQQQLRCTGGAPELGVASSSAAHSLSPRRENDEAEEEEEVYHRAVQRSIRLREYRHLYGSLLDNLERIFPDQEEGPSVVNTEEETTAEERFPSSAPRSVAEPRIVFVHTLKDYVFPSPSAAHRSCGAAADLSLLTSAVGATFAGPILAAEHAPRVVQRVPFPTFCAEMFDLVAESRDIQQMRQAMASSSSSSHPFLNNALFVETICSTLRFPPGSFALREEDEELWFTALGAKHYERLGDSRRAVERQIQEAETLHDTTAMMEQRQEKEPLEGTNRQLKDRGARYVASTKSPLRPTSREVTSKALPTANSPRRPLPQTVNHRAPISATRSPISKSKRTQKPAAAIGASLSFTKPSAAVVAVKAQPPSSRFATAPVASAVAKTALNPQHQRNVDRPISSTCTSMDRKPTKNSPTRRTTSRSRSQQYRDPNSNAAEPHHHPSGFGLDEWREMMLS